MLDQMNRLLTFIGVTLVALGPAALVSPPFAARMYGISADTPSAEAYLLAAATRDVALGIGLLTALGFGARRRVLAALLLGIALVAAGDAANVLLHAGWKNPLALAVHIGGFAVVLTIGLWLWRTDGA